jgi:tetratricopeptide (TPR) repeat protein
MKEDYASCVEVIEKYFESVSDTGDAYEESELVLFLSLALEKQNKFEESFQQIQKRRGKIVDKFYATSTSARLLTLQDKHDEALRYWTILLKDQPDNSRFHIGAQLAVLRVSSEFAKDCFAKDLLPSATNHISEEQKKTLYDWYNALSLESKLLTKIKLSLSLNSTEFVANLTPYLVKSLNTGVPSLFQDIISIFGANRLNKRSMSDVTTYILPLLEDVQTKQLLSPVGILWSKYLQAKLLELSGVNDEALKLISECIDHTPTAIDMYTLKASILLKIGHFQTAADIMDLARSLDLQDRYLNNEATKFHLRAGGIQKALDTISIFTKHEGDPQKTLYDLQCSWYELELGDAYSRSKSWFKAISKYNAVRDHFKEEYNDLFDFHGYCIRKVQLLFVSDFIN